MTKKANILLAVFLASAPALAGTDVSAFVASCWQELKALYPDTTPVTEKPVHVAWKDVRTARKDLQRVAAAFDADPVGIHTLVFENAEGQPLAVVTFRRPDSGGPSSVDRRPGHLIVTRKPGIGSVAALADHVAVLADQVAEQVAEAKTPMPASLSASTLKKLLAADVDTLLRGGGPIERTTRGVDGKTTLRMQVGSEGSGIVVEHDGNGVTVSIGPERLREWGKGSIGFESRDALHQIHAAVDVLLYGGDHRSYFPSPWRPIFRTVPADDLEYQLIRGYKARQWTNSVLEAPAIREGHPYTQVMALSGILQEIERSGIQARAVRVETPRGRRVIVSALEGKEFPPRTLQAMAAHPPKRDYEIVEGRFGLMGHMSDLAVEGIPRDEVDDELERVMPLARLLRLDEDDTRRLRFQVVAQGLLGHPWAVSAATLRSVGMPRWVVELRGLGDVETPWKSGSDAIVAAAKDRRLAPWFVAALPHAQRAAYVEWLDGIPAGKNDRIVDKYYQLAWSMPPEEVEAVLGWGGRK